MSKIGNGVTIVKKGTIDDTDSSKQLWWNNQGYQVAKGFKESFSNAKTEHKKIESSAEISEGLFRKPATVSGVLVLRTETEYKQFLSQVGKGIVSNINFLTFIKKSGTENEIDHFTLRNMALMDLTRVRDGLVGLIRVNVTFEEYEVIKQDVLGDDRTSPGVPPKIKAGKKTITEREEKAKHLYGMGLKLRTNRAGKVEWYDPTTGRIYGGEII